jgi:UDP-GlcNAc:undecaprenyl-phosphate/decaprenyl-phosphate GlcNAc-1-phosphate transferase
VSSFPLNGYLLAFIGALLTAALALPFWRSVCRRVGLVDDPGHRKIHHTAIPLAGGLAIVTALVLPLLAGAGALWLHIFDDLTVDLLAYGFGARALQLAAIVIGALGMLALGVADDRWELRPAIKFVGQLLIAGLVVASGVRFDLLPGPVLINAALTVVWILAIVNAFNFMDNMNGLCAGLGVIAACYCGVIAAAHGQYLVALLAFLTMGALVGFLPYNYPKASVFLGDAGSHLVGYLIAVLAVMPQFSLAEQPRVIDLINPVFLVAVPLADLVWVVLLRWRNRKPFYVGDTNHISHQLVRRGLSPQRAVALIWTAAALLGALAFL